MSHAGATEEILWDNDLVFKVAGKMFCCSGIETGSRFSFKTTKERFFEMTELPGILPAPYLARANWIQIDPAVCPLSDAQIEGLIRASYTLVVSKLPKKTQKALREEK